MGYVCDEKCYGNINKVPEEVTFITLEILQNDFLVLETTKRLLLLFNALEKVAVQFSTK